MVTAVGACEHPHGAIYWDTDEWRCRQCSRSLSFPARSPVAAESRERKHDPNANAPRTAPLESLSCLHCRAWAYPLPAGDSGAVSCPTCSRILAIIGLDGRRSFPPFTPPRLLECTCCRRLKPQFTFNANANARNREGRDYMCRACAAFRARVRREERGAEIRQRDQLRQAARRDSLTPEQKAEEHRVPKADNKAAARRTRARKAGRAVPKQRGGRPTILLKPVCRIQDTCPLARFCVDKAPSDQPTGGRQ